MNKRTKIGIAAVGILAISSMSSIGSTPASSSLQPPIIDKAAAATVKTPEAAKVDPTCDGTSVTTDCQVDGIAYQSYIYHPAVAEKSHNETITTYEKQVTGNCTLCNDGTYSPSCATGRGACSHHGGVQEWNAPRYASVPVTNTKSIIDTPAQAAYYEKITR